MQLTDKIFKGLYRRGVMLEQMKEPALSRTVKQMEPVEPCENPRDIDALSPEEILHMDWLCGNVRGSIPQYDALLPMAKPMVRLLGLYRDSLQPEKRGPLL